ncbi:PAS domain-containing protein [Nitrosarchaeum koreense]|nr:PAS domain-containing protein [Nitrosarchaeum koreense]
MSQQTTSTIEKTEDTQLKKSLKLTELVDQSFVDLSTISEQLGSTINDLENASQTQTSGIEEVATSISSIASAIQSVADNASKCMDSMRQSEQITQNISADAEKGMEKMDNMKTIVSESADDVRTLAKELIKVDNMTGFITQIAEQTNLLALNAAIEAARAGDVGRGFAVVADEVRRLAENSKKGAEDISKLISTLKESSNKTTASIEKGNGLVEESYEMVTNILTSIKDITKAITEVVSQMQEISAATEEVSSGTEEATAAGEEILSIAQTNHQSFENILKVKNREEKILEKASEAAGKLSRTTDVMDESTVVLSMDPDGIMTDVNHFLCTTSRYPLEELLGQHQRILGSGWHDPNTADNMWEVLRSGKVYKTYKRNRAKDGSIYWIKIVVSPVYRDGVIVRFLEVGTIVTGLITLFGIEDGIRELEAKKSLTNKKLAPIIAKLKSGDYQLQDNIPI